MKIYSILGVILVALCFFACKSNKENEYQPLTIENYAEVWDHGFLTFEVKFFIKNIYI